MRANRVERRTAGYARALRRLVAAALVAGCGGMAGGVQGGESHFLAFCGAGCGDGLDCISGVCTRGCLVGESACGDLSPDARCTASSIEPGEVAVCDVACDADTGCAALGDGYACVDGYCRGGAPSSPPAGSCRVAHRSYPSGSAGVPAPSGCGTCTCLDGELSCTEPDCAAGAPVFRCPDTITSDPIDVRRGYIAGDSVTVHAGHGGGCARHDYAMCFIVLDPEISADVSLRLIHDAHGDTCEAYALPVLRFDLRPLARALSGPDPDVIGSALTEFGLYAYGAFSCLDRERLAEEQMLAATEAVSAESETRPNCVTAADCRVVSTDTGCSANCGALAGAMDAEELASAVDNVDGAICRDAAADGCSPTIPPCVPPPPAACVNGRCAFAP